MYLPRRVSAPITRTVEPLGQCRRKRPAQIGPAQFGADDPPPADPQRQAAPHGLDFRQFGHCTDGFPRPMAAAWRARPDGGIFLPDERGTRKRRRCARLPPCARGREGAAGPRHLRARRAALRSDERSDERRHPSAVEGRNGGVAEAAPRPAAARHGRRHRRHRAARAEAPDPAEAGDRRGRRGRRGRGNRLRRQPAHARDRPRPRPRPGHPARHRMARRRGRAAALRRTQLRSLCDRVRLAQRDPDRGRTRRGAPGAAARAAGSSASNSPRR